MIPEPRNSFRKTQEAHRNSRVAAKSIEIEAATDEQLRRARERTKESLRATALNRIILLGFAAIVGSGFVALMVWWLTY